MKLYTFPPSPNCQKVAALAYELGLTLEIIPVNIFKGDSRLPDYLAKNPNGRVPLLEDGDFLLWESNAIVTYLAAQNPGSGLLPTAPRERAEVDRWLFWQTAHLSPAVGKVAFERIVKPMTGRGPADQAIVDAGTAEFHAHVKAFETALGTKEYVTGRLSVADFALTPYFAVSQVCGLDLGPYPATRAWLGRMVARPSVQRAQAEARPA